MYLDRPFLGHGYILLLTCFIYEDSDHHIDVVVACSDDFLDLVFTLETEWHHNLVREPAFLDFSEPVSGLHLVANFGYRGEFPRFLVVQRIGIFTSLEEYGFHGCQVVLKAIVNARQQARPQRDFQHPSLELHRVTVLKPPSALKHLDGCFVSIDLDDFSSFSATGPSTCTVTRLETIPITVPLVFIYSVSIIRWQARCSSVFRRCRALRP